MQVEQIYSLVNDIASEALGESNVLSEDLSNIKMTGESIVNAIGYDNFVGKIVDKARKNGVQVLITADHGNAECMEDNETHAPYTAHTTNPVPFFMINTDKNLDLRDGGSLCDIAPTVLELLGIPQPEEMTGVSLIKH